MSYWLTWMLWVGSLFMLVYASFTQILTCLSPSVTWRPLGVAGSVWVAFSCSIRALGRSAHTSSAEALPGIHSGKPWRSDIVSRGLQSFSYVRFHCSNYLSLSNGSGSALEVKVSFWWWLKDLALCPQGSIVSPPTEEKQNIVSLLQKICLY